MSNHFILCVTPNPCVEHTVTVPNFRLGEVHRTTSATIYTGGKGFNAARSIAAIGGASQSVSLAGGHAGQQAMEMLAREGLRCVWSPIREETRTCMLVVDPHASDATVINEDGPLVNEQEWQKFHQMIVAQASEAALAAFVCLCGSLPPGPQPERLGDLVTTLQRVGARVWVDNRNRPMEFAVAARPYGIKVNGREAASLLGGREISDVATALQAALALQQRGIEHVVITLGADGAVSVNSHERWWVKPPLVKQLNSAGSGDAFLGALTWRLAQGRSVADALCSAAAAGAANAITTLAGEVYGQDIARLQPTVTIERIADNSALAFFQT